MFIGRLGIAKHMSDGDEFDLIDRSTGILTKKDRQYLLGEFEHESWGAERHRRWRFRQRLRNVLWDFFILNESMPISEVEQVFEDIYDWREEAEVAQARGNELPPVPDLWDAWKAAVEFLVFSMVGLEIGGQSLEEAISSAIYQHQLYFEDKLVDIEVSVEADWENADEHTIDEIETRVEEKDLPEDPLKADQMLTALLRKNRISFSEYEDLASEYVEGEI